MDTYQHLRYCFWFYTKNAESLEMAKKTDGLFYGFVYVAEECDDEFG